MEKVSSINFKAIPLNKITVQKYNKSTKNFVPQTARFVKLEANNRLDIEAIESAAKNWKNTIYIKKIATAAHWMDNVPIEIYALTTQQDKYKKLKYKNILGFAEMRQDGINPNYKELCHLEVNPNAVNSNNSDKKTYKEVGSSMLTSLKKQYKKISLYVNNKSVEKFYKKNKFIRDYSADDRFVWSSNPFSGLLIRIENMRKRFWL